MAGSTKVTTDREYSVSIEAVGDGWQGHDDEADRLVTVLAETPEAMGAVTSWGGLSGGPGMTASFIASSPIAAGERALGTFEKALAEIGFGPVEIARLDVMTVERQEAELSEPPREYAGLAEVAGILGVSKQRVGELRRRADFPRPVAELASGPVWDRSWLNHFVESWDRRPGRPRRRRLDD